MLGLNKAYFIGRVGRDPEHRTSSKGTAFATVTIAVPNRRQQDDGTWIDNPDWHRLVAFGKVADWLSRDVRKGDSVAVECCVRHKKWSDKDGQTRYETSIVVERLLWHMRKVGAQAVIPALDAQSPAVGLPEQVEPVVEVGTPNEDELPF